MILYLNNLLNFVACTRPAPARIDKAFLLLILNFMERYLYANSVFRETKDFDFTQTHRINEVFQPKKIKDAFNRHCQANGVNAFLQMKIRKINLQPNNDQTLALSRPRRTSN